MLVRFLTEGFLLGLATGHICLATCGPVYAPFLLEKSHNWKSSLLLLFKICCGRFITYAGFGAVAGIVGSQIPIMGRPYFTASAYLLFSVMLFFSAFRAHQMEKGCAVPSWGRFAESPFVLGIATGINFCPPFLLALTRAMDLSGPLSGCLLFIAFFLGTSLFLIPLFVFGLLGNKRLMRTAGRISAVLVGTWFITQAILFFVKALLPIANQSETSTDIVTLLDSTRAVVLSSDSASCAELRKALVLHRSGGVEYAADTLHIQNKAIVFVDRRWLNITGTRPETLKRPHRFVFVLPAAGGRFDRAYSERLLTFLQTYSFRAPRGAAVLFTPEQFAPAIPAK